MLLPDRNHAIVHLDAFVEDYLIPLPICHVKGFLSGRLYAELSGTYHIMSSSGYVSEMVFSGQDFRGRGERNSVHATIYRRDNLAKEPIYTVGGRLNDKFTIFFMAAATVAARVTWLRSTTRTTLTTCRRWFECCRSRSRIRES